MPAPDHRRDWYMAAAGEAAGVVGSPEKPMRPLEGEPALGKHKPPCTHTQSTRTHKYKHTATGVES